MFLFPLNRILLDVVAISNTVACFTSAALSSNLVSIMKSTNGPVVSEDGLGEETRRAGWEKMNER